MKKSQVRHALLDSACVEVCVGIVVELVFIINISQLQN